MKNHKIVPKPQSTTVDNEGKFASDNLAQTSTNLFPLQTQITSPTWTSEGQQKPQVQKSPQISCLDISHKHANDLQEFGTPPSGIPISHANCQDNTWENLTPAEILMVAADSLPDTNGSNLDPTDQIGNGRFLLTQDTPMLNSQTEMSTQTDAVFCD